MPYLVVGDNCAMPRSSFTKNKGFLITKGDLSLLTQAKSLTKKGAFLNSDQQKGYFRAVQQYLNSINGKTVALIEDVPILDYSEQQNSDKTFYKYTSKSALETYYKKGIFRLGTIGDYQSTKKENIKDENEGYTHLILQTDSNQLLQSFCGGFNYLLFCGSHIPPEDPRAEYLKKNFGPCVLKVSNLNSFRRAISKHLNIKYSYYHEVGYCNLQIFKKKIDYDLYEDKTEIFTDQTFKEIGRITANISIFSKWESFTPEHEMRFAFELPFDQKHPKTIHNKGLLDYIEIIE